MKRTLRPRNSLQKKVPFTFDETPSKGRPRRSIDRKTGGLKEHEKFHSCEGEEGGLNVSTAGDPSNELGSKLAKEQNKEQYETREKKRPRGRPRKSQGSKVESLQSTERVCEVESSQDELKNRFKENDNSSALLVEEHPSRNKNLTKEGLTNENGNDNVASRVTAQSRRLIRSRKRQRQDDDDEMVENDFVDSNEGKRSKRSRRRTVVDDVEGHLHDSTEEQTSHTSRHNKTRTTQDSSSEKIKISEKDYQEFQEVILATELELKQNKAVLCPSCKKTKSKSLPNLLHHLKYLCPSYKASAGQYDCTLCNKKCRSFATLDKHIKTVHSENNPLQSKSPEKMTKIEFIKLCKQQGGKVKCPKANCERKFTTVEGIKYHFPRCGIEVKPILKCEYCGKAYTSKPGLSFHINSAHTQPKLLVSSSKESAEPTGKRGAAARAMKKLHEIALEGEIQDSRGNGDEFLSEMAACRMIKELFSSPVKYKPTPVELATWKSEVEQAGHISCPYCKKTWAALKFMKIHISGCKWRPGREPFCCLTCKAEFKSRQQILKHLKNSHQKLVAAILEKARKVEENEWKPAGDDDGEDEDEFIEDEELEPEEEEEETEEEEELVEGKKKKSVRRFGNRFDGTSLDDCYRHVVVQVLKSTKETKCFRAKHHCSVSETLFPDWKVDISKWNAVSESLAAAYHPLTKESAMFVIEKRKGRNLQEKTEMAKLPLYGALPVEKAAEQVTFFVGGPVWALDWCPVPDDAPLAHSYVALNCYLEMDHTQFFDEIEPAPSLMQIWDLGVLESGTTTTPRMVLGIAHDHGNTNSIKWCPSGGYQPIRDTLDSEEPPRLGLLAVACSVGFVAIYSVPHPTGDQTICKPDPVITLKPTRLNEWFGPCLCLDWSQKEGHSRIVGGFSNGAVTVWNLHTASSLLAEEMNGCKYLYPTQVLFACTSFVIAVSLNPNDDNYLMVCSIDRATSMWDVRFPSCPLDEINFCTALDCHWPLHYQLGMVSTENHAINSRACVVHLFDSSLYNSYFTEMTLHSSVWSFSISDWLHCIAAGADDGQVGINMYMVPDKTVKYKCSARIKQRIVTEIVLEDKPSHLCDQPSNNEQPVLTSEKKMGKAKDLTENCSQETEGCNVHEQSGEMADACSNAERNKECKSSQVLAESKDKGYSDVELLNDLETKASDVKDEDESLVKTSKEGKVNASKESKTEEEKQQSLSQLTSEFKGDKIVSNGAMMQGSISNRTEADSDSQNVEGQDIFVVDSAKLQEIRKHKQQSKSVTNSGGGNQINSNGADTESVILNRTEVQDIDSQNVAEEEFLAVNSVGRTRHAENEADSAKLQESDVSETRQLNEGDIEILGDTSEGVEKMRESIQPSDEQLIITRKESPVSGTLSNSIGRNGCSEGEQNVAKGKTVSTKGKQLADNVGLDHVTTVGVKSLDGKKFCDVKEKMDGKDGNIGPLENGVNLTQPSLNESCESVEICKAITNTDVNANSSKTESESCAILDENKFKEIKIGSLDTEINELLSKCHSTLEDLKECSALTDDNAASASTNDRKISPKKQKPKKKKQGKEVGVPQEKKLCIRDKEFDIRQVFGDSEVTAKDEEDAKVEENKDALRTRIKGWRPKYKETETSKCIVYKDYFEPVYGSSTWTPLSKNLLARTDQKSKTNTTDFHLNAVNKVAWSPNFHSCRWLLVAGNNGIVRAVHMSCLDPSQVTKKS